MIIYKTMNGTAGAYGYGHWSMPTQNDDGSWTPGEWMPPVKPRLCNSGYHGCPTLEGVLRNIGPELFRMEVRGECDAGRTKQAWEEARLLSRVETWNERNLRLFAVDCIRLLVANLAQDSELAHACLDVAVGYAEGFVDEVALAAAAGPAVPAMTAWSTARDMAWVAALEGRPTSGWKVPSALLARYLAGEEGPFVEEES